MRPSHRLFCLAYSSFLHLPIGLYFPYFLKYLIILTNVYWRKRVRYELAFTGTTHS